MVRCAIFAWAFLFLLESTAQAGILRFDVTGGFLRDELGVSAADPDDPDLVVDPTLTLDMIPDDQLPVWYASMLRSTEGQAFFDGKFTRCSGLLTLLCSLDFDRDPSDFPQISFAFDAALDTFELSFPDYDMWGIEMSNAGFFYSDSNDFWVRIGNISYSVLGVSIWGEFSSVGITHVPLPGSAALLLPALGGLVVLRLRRRDRVSG